MGARVSDQTQFGPLLLCRLGTCPAACQQSFTAQAVVRRLTGGTQANTLLPLCARAQANEAHELTGLCTLWLHYLTGHLNCTPKRVFPALRPTRHAS